MTRFASMMIAFVAIVQLLLGPVAFAQSGEPLPDAPELEVCVLPWDDYKIFSNYRLNYMVAVADEDPVFAQDLFGSMQDILGQHCDAVASIIQVQSDTLDASCNDLVNHLLAKNNYYVQALNADDATATQSLIQTVLLAQTCDPILSPSSEVAIELIQEDIAASQTIDLALEVIPYTNNICFNTYGPSQTFRQQVENIQEATVATSVFDIVSNYANQLGNMAVDTVQEYREGALLSFARNILGFKKTSLQFMDYRNQGVPFQTTEFVQFVSSLTSTNALQAAGGLVADYIGGVEDYMDTLGQAPVFASFAEPVIANIVASLSTTPIVVLRDDDLQTFVSQTASADDRGLSILFPALTQQVADPSDPANTITQTLRASTALQILEVQGNSVMIEQYNDDTQAYEMVEDFLLTHMVAELYYADAKIAAIDMELTYDTNQDIIASQAAIYLDPYIITAQATVDRQTDGDGNSTTVVDIDTRFFGPGGCDVRLDMTQTKTYPSQGDNTSTQAFTFILNNTRVEAVFNNLGNMIDAIRTHRETIPTATSAPSTSSHIVKLDIFFKPLQNPLPQAYLYPENNAWSIGFPEATGWIPRSFVSVYRNPAIAANPIDTTMLARLRDLWQQMDGGTKEPETTIIEQPDPDGDEGGSGYEDVYGCTDPAATNHNPDATTDDGSCTLPAAGPVVGCPDPDALNYVPGADENDWDNRALCER